MNPTEILASQSSTVRRDRREAVREVRARMQTWTFLPEHLTLTSRARRSRTHCVRRFRVFIFRTPTTRPRDLCFPRDCGGILNTFRWITSTADLFLIWP